jgi:hypothetical protein
MPSRPAQLRLDVGPVPADHSAITADPFSIANMGCRAFGTRRVAFERFPLFGTEELYIPRRVNILHAATRSGQAADQRTPLGWMQAIFRVHTCLSQASDRAARAAWS